MPDRILPALLALVVLTGCVGLAPGNTDGTPPPSTEKPTSEIPPPEDCGDTWVAFYAVGTDAQDRIWDADVISIGFTVPGNESVFFVVYEDGPDENGTILGTTHVEYDADYAVTADGKRVKLDSPLSGEHTVRVIAHEDSNGDGTFDRTTDSACLSDGQLVQAGPTRFDFDEFADD